MSVQQEFIQSLIQQETKLSLEEFFKTIHTKFYSTQDISFMEYFLELTNHEGEFIVHHKKLIEYGIVTSIRSSTIKEKLNALGLVENEEYSLLQDVLQQWEGTRGIKHTKVYMLTPEAFKKCLMRAQRRPKQTVDPVMYCDYYLLLEKIHKLYTDYEKQLLNKQLEQNQQQLEEERQYRLGLEEGLLANTTPLESTQIIYIATSINYAKQNRFKIGGVGTIDKTLQEYFYKTFLELTNHEN